MQLEISESHLCVEKEQGRKEDAGLILLSKSLPNSMTWEAGGNSEEALRPSGFGAPVPSAGGVQRRGDISSRHRWNAKRISWIRCKQSGMIDTNQGKAQPSKGTSFLEKQVEKSNLILNT